MKIKVNVNAAAVLRKRGLGDSTKAKKYLASTVKRLCDPYVPMSAGSGAHMKNQAEINESGGVVELRYPGPYAHYQYVGEVMGPNYTDGKGRFWSGKAPKHYTGRAIQYTDAPMRGKEWDKRMMADRGDEVVDALADFVGGKRK